MRLFHHTEEVVLIFTDLVEMKTFKSSDMPIGWYWERAEYKEARGEVHVTLSIKYGVDSKAEDVLEAGREYWQRHHEVGGHD